MVPSIIAKTFELDEYNYYKTHLSIINGVLPHKVRLTERETDVMASILKTAEKYGEEICFSTTGRRILKKEQGLGNAGLTNYLKALEEKGFIIKNNDTYLIAKLVLVNNKQQEYRFKIKLNG